MAKISDILNEGRTISFEFFPPRTAEAEAQLEQTLRELEPLRPSYVSVTYGAGGATRERTHELVVQINRDLDLTAIGAVVGVPMELGGGTLWLFSIVDAYRTARHMQAEAATAGRTA